MIIIFNIPGALALGAGIAIAYCLFPAHREGSYGMLAGWLVTALLDAASRWVRHRDSGWLRFILPTTGGHLFFIPVWMIGLLLAGSGAARIHQQAKHDNLMVNAIQATRELRETLEHVGPGEEKGNARIDQLRARRGLLIERVKILGIDEYTRLKNQFGDEFDEESTRLKQELVRLSLPE